jgi:heme A synthase
MVQVKRERRTEMKKVAIGTLLMVCLVGILGGCAFTTTELKLDYAAPVTQKLRKLRQRLR